MARRLAMRITPRPRPNPRDRLGGQGRARIPSSPPPSMYDPSLDAQERAAQRGLADLLADIGEGGRLSQRGWDDYLLEQQELQRQKAEALQDLATQRAREGQNYTSAIEGLQRRYTQLGSRQAQSTTAAGAGRGGALAQALAKRTENQAIDRKPIDTGYQRFQEDANLREQRIGEATDRGLGELGLNWNRQLSDWSTVDIPRAQREQTWFSHDINQQRIGQAKGMGWDPLAGLPTRRTGNTGGGGGGRPGRGGGGGSSRRGPQAVWRPVAQPRRRARLRG